MNCIDCEDCFLCAGLVGKRYHILNKEFSPETYQTEKERIITDMKNKGMYSEFFPGYFAPTGYDESASWVYAPLSREEQEQLWFRTTERYQGKSTDFKSPSTLPDRLCDVTEEVTSGWYWDDDSGRPFQVLSEDITFYQSLGTALNDRFYIRRIRENFAWMFPTYELRETTCAKSGKQIMTTLGAELDGRIVSLEEYEKLVW